MPQAEYVAVFHLNILPSPLHTLPLPYILPPKSSHAEEKPVPDLKMVQTEQKFWETPTLFHNLITFICGQPEEELRGANIRQHISFSFSM